MELRYDAIVLGGGAAGLMCAIEAGARGRRVAVLERSDGPGKKILISGGGRCNFTNLHCTAQHFLGSNPHFAKSALARYTPADFIAMVRRHGILYHEKKLGQLFCDGSSREIVSMLERECRERGVSIFANVAVTSVRHGDGFEIRSSDGTFRAPALVIATGGLSIPKIGATGFGYEIARQFGLRVSECRPALVPLTFAEDDLRTYGDLAGLSFDAVVSFERAQFREKALITHRGLSGPAILQISSYWRPGAGVSLDLAPEKNVFGPLLAGSKRDPTAARAALRLALADRLADRWMELNAPERWKNADVAELERHVHCWTVHPAGTEGYAKAEVTAGGVDTDELSARTMESRRMPGLYFIGEVVDVTGHLGGFNFQWAWASGFCAGQAL